MVLLTALRPVVSSATLTENHVIRTKQAPERSRADGIHGTGLEVNQDRTRDILVRASLIVEDVNALELEIVRALVDTIALDAVFFREDFPEFGADLVAALCFVLTENRTWFWKMLTWPVWRWTISRML